VITCTLTSSAACPETNPVISNSLNISVISVPSVIFLNDITVSNIRCYDATQTITVAGNDHLFVVETGGAVTMIAGQQISYLPGTIVQPGGYMHGYIAPEGPFCFVPAMVATGTGQGINSEGAEMVSCAAVPNPTHGLFRITCKGWIKDLPAAFQVYNMQGIMIMSEGMLSPEQPVSLEGYAPGIYLVRISQGDAAGMVRVVKL
jgi:hypothetical protein